MSAVERAGPDVLADLLVAASEAGPEKLVETNALLRELAGSEAVGEAHRTWTDRLRRGLLRDDRDDGHDHGHDPAREDVFHLIGRLRADTSKHLRRA